MHIQDYDTAYAEIQEQMKTADKIARTKRETDQVETLTDQPQQRVDLRSLLHDNLGDQKKRLEAKDALKFNLTHWTGLFRYALIVIIQTVMIFSSGFMNVRNKLVLIISSSLMYHIIMQRQIYKANGTTTTNTIV